MQVVKDGIGVLRVLPNKFLVESFKNEIVKLDLKK